MVDTRTGKSTWSEDYVPPQGRRRKKPSPEKSREHTDAPAIPDLVPELAAAVAPAPEQGPAKQPEEEKEMPSGAIPVAEEAAADAPAVKIKDSELAEWREIGEGTVVQYDGFTPVKDGVKVNNRFFKIPAMLTGPSVFPAWFVHYFSGDHSIRVEGWEDAAKAASATPKTERKLIAMPSLSPIVEEPESEHEPSPELTPDSTPEPSITSSSDAEEGPASGLETGNESEGVLDAWIPIPVWGDATSVVAHSAVLETPRPKATAADADAPVTPATGRGSETKAPRQNEPLTLSELQYANKVMRVRTYEGLDAAIAFICNSNQHIDPELAKQWVNYMHDAMNRRASLTPKVMRDFKNGFWPGYGPGPRTAPLPTSPTWPAESPPQVPSPNKRKATVEDVSDEEDMPEPELRRPAGTTLR
ncbi:hypothetical protein AURDEDRAFT_124118 [Auricularia subglabra TFB-10046 SS5]|nr:hypothetical protein AURDEDRAFT_124118 [Auricularia subglabra TFB-10046 SS5]